MPEQENTQTEEKESKLVPILGTSIEPDDDDNILEGEEEDEKEEGLQEQEQKEVEAKEETPEEDEPKEKEESKEVSYADFLAAKTAGEEVPPKLAAKEEVQQPKKPTARDYSGIDEEHVSLFRDMSNDSFAALKPVYQEHRRFKQDLQSKEQELEILKKAATGQEVIHPSFFSHPKAFMLTKEYGQRLANARLADGVLNHWNAQLVKIRRGEDWQDLQEDSKTGQLYIAGDAKAATQDDELEVMKRVSEAQQLAIEWKTKVNSYEQEHKSKFEQDINLIRDTEKQFFPDYDKPDHPTRKIQDAVINALPSSLKEDPLAKTLSYVSANNVLLQAENQKLMKENAELKAQINGKTKVTKQPTKADFGTAGKGTRFPTYEDFINKRED